MTPDLSNNQERRLSERYSRGKKSTRDETEARVFQAYDMIGNALRSRKVSDFDAEALANRMAREMDRGGTPKRSPAFEGRFRRVCAQAALGAVLLIIGLSALWAALDAGKTRSVRSVEWVDASTGKEKGVPLLWKHTLETGRMVDVPDNVQAELKLAEGSVVTCVPGTSLAVRKDAQRKIKLDSGRIAVRAAHIPNSTLSVETPLGDVQVLGTVFWVEVVRRGSGGEK